MAVQVCLMSHCCDYQHGALAQLEAPQVNQGGEASICSAGGPQTTLMGFHLLLGHWTFWKAPAQDAPGLLVGADIGARLKLDTLGARVLCLFLAHRSSCLPLWARIPYMFTFGLFGFMCACVFLPALGYRRTCLYKSSFPGWHSQSRSRSADALNLGRLCSVLLLSHVTVLGEIIHQNLSHSLLLPISKDQHGALGFAPRWGGCGFHAAGYQRMGARGIRTE